MPWETINNVDVWKPEKDKWDKSTQKWTTQDTSDSEKRVAEDCSWSEKYTGGTFHISPEVMSVIKKLCDVVKDEWQMLLIGHEDKNDVYIWDYYIPKQEISAASVENKDCIGKDEIDKMGIIATMHSHSDMGVFFSSVDEEYTNLSLIRHHIVVNNKGEMKATTRYLLPCKMEKFFDATVVVDTPSVDIIKDIENIERKVYTVNAGFSGSLYEDSLDELEALQMQAKAKEKRKSKKRKKALAELEVTNE